MKKHKINLIFKLLSLILGIFFVGVALRMSLTGDFSLWVGFFIGLLFIYYALVGNKGLLKSRWLSGYGKKTGK